MSATKTPLSEIISISDLPWQERQPGVRAKSLWADPATKRQAVLSRIEAGAKLPLHRHVGDELAAYALHQQDFEFARELLQIAPRGVGGTYR